MNETVPAAMFYGASVAPPGERFHSGTIMYNETSVQQTLGSVAVDSADRHVSRRVRFVGLSEGCP